MPYLNQLKGESDLRNLFHYQSLRKCCQTWQGSNPQPPNHQPYVHPTESPRLAREIIINIYGYLSKAYDRFEKHWDIEKHYSTTNNHNTQNKIIITTTKLLSQGHFQRLEWKENSCTWGQRTCLGDWMIILECFLFLLGSNSTRGLKIILHFNREP